MKELALIILIILPQVTFCQNDDDKLLIQNFYESCKAQNYSVFTSVNKGIQLLDTKQYSRSLNNFEKALIKDSNYCDPWYLIGHCYQKTGDFKGSVIACDKSLEINPNNPSALVIKANSLFLMQDTLTAITFYKKAKEISPDKVDGYYGLALMFYLMEQKESASNILLEMDKNNVKTVKFRDNKKIKELRKQVQ